MSKLGKSFSCAQKLTFFTYSGKKTYTKKLKQ